MLVMWRIILIVLLTKNLHIQFIGFKYVIKSIRIFKTIVLGKNNLNENNLFIGGRDVL